MDSEQLQSWSGCHTIGVSSWKSWKELFLSIPEGYKEFLGENEEQVNGEYLKLIKSIYGLVQAARAWWKRFVEVLTKDLNFEQYANNSCLLRRKDANGIIYLIMYVDNCFVIGNKQAIKKALDDIEKHFDIKQSEEISDFIGCTIERQDNRVLL